MGGTAQEWSLLGAGVPRLGEIGKPRCTVYIRQRLSQNCPHSTDGRGLGAKLAPEGRGWPGAGGPAAKLRGGLCRVRRALVGTSVSFGSAIRKSWPLEGGRGFGLVLSEAVAYVVTKGALYQMAVLLDTALWQMFNSITSRCHYFPRRGFTAFPRASPSRPWAFECFSGGC